MEYPPRITNEYLNSLPKILLKPTGDVTCYVRYDEAQNLIYMLDGEGNFTGKVAPADKMVKEAAQETAEQEASEPNQESVIAEEETAEESEPQEQPQNVKWKVPALIGIAVVVIIIIAVVLGKASSIVNNKKMEQEKELSTHQVQTKETDPTDTPIEAAVETTEAPTEATQETQCTFYTFAHLYICKKRNVTIYLLDESKIT